MPLKVTSQALGQTCNYQRAGDATLKNISNMTNGSDRNDTVTKKAQYNNMQISHTYTFAARNMDNMFPLD